MYLLCDLVSVFQVLLYSYFVSGSIFLAPKAQGLRAINQALSRGSPVPFYVTRAIPAAPQTVRLQIPRRRRQ
jgi:hypothetical protein